MLKYSLMALSAATATKLTTLQTQVNVLTTRREQYEKAKVLFSNKKNASWAEIKRVLEKCAPTGKACYYCERDRYRDIEHIMPKLHYPDRCFDWENYIYACAICNQDKKNDTFAVIDANNVLIVFNRTYDITIAVPVGTPALIDIRSEDPLDFLALDLETGRFTPIGDAVSQIRGDFTRKLFDLNESSLADIRIAAYGAYCHYLKMFKEAIEQDDAHRANRIFNEIKKLNHPTVLVEMRRQSVALPYLAALFTEIPASLGARPT